LLTRFARKILQGFPGTFPQELSAIDSGNPVRHEVAAIEEPQTRLAGRSGPVRVLITGGSQGARVLNLFAYTCAFSVSAIAHDAVFVVNNDMNANVLHAGKRNHEANRQDLRRVSMVPHNLFKSWKRIRSQGPYDVIIIDPPTNQRGSFVAEKHYPLVLKKLPEIAAPQARILACLNSPFLAQDFLQNLMARWCPRSRFLQRLPAHPDFPEAFPDQGLKVLEFVYAK
jgi:23S rRNA (cytosine1962-C5)-methyltransferase